MLCVGHFHRASRVFSPESAMQSSGPRSVNRVGGTGERGRTILVRSRDKNSQLQLLTIAYFTLATAV